MHLLLTPCGDGGLVTPEGEGESLAGLGDACEAFDGDGAIELREQSLRSAAMSR
jgi:hypothetical protein